MLPDEIFRRLAVWQQAAVCFLPLAAAIAFAAALCALDHPLHRKVLCNGVLLKMCRLQEHPGPSLGPSPSPRGGSGLRQLLTGGAFAGRPAVNPPASAGFVNNRKPPMGEDAHLTIQHIHRCFSAVSLGLLPFRMRVPPGGVGSGQSNFLPGWLRCEPEVSRRHHQAQHGSDDLFDG
jgi:hypothetical protein